MNIIDVETKMEGVWAKVKSMLWKFWKTFRIILITTIVLVVGLGILAAKLHQQYEDKIKVNAEKAAKQEVVDKEDMLTKQRLVKAMMYLQPKMDTVMAQRIADEVYIESKDSGMDPALVTAIIDVESQFNPFAEGNDSYGLMQIRFKIWKESDELENAGASQRGALFWVDKNIKSGVGILKKYYILSNQDLARTLYRYNTGSNVLPGSQYDVRYVNQVMYNAYIVKSFLAGDREVAPSK